MVKEEAPAVVAHRGYAKHYPENTLLALSAAVDAGAQFIEFDIQLSKDGVPFLIHDDNLQRTAGLDQSVFDLSMSELETISVGEAARFGSQFKTEKLIRLDSLCEHLNNWQSVYSFIEIKRQSAERFGTDIVVQNVLNALKSMQASYTLISFSQEVVATIQKLSSESAGWVIGKWDKQNLQDLETLSPDFIFCNYQKIPENQPLPKGQGAWVLYDFDDPVLAKKWLNAGADLIETMAVKSMIDALSLGE